MRVDLPGDFPIGSPLFIATHMMRHPSPWVAHSFFSAFCVAVSSVVEVTPNCQRRDGVCAVRLICKSSKTKKNGTARRPSLP